MVPTADLVPDLGLEAYTETGLPESAASREFPAGDHPLPGPWPVPLRSYNTGLACRASNDDNFYLDDEERRIGNPWTHAKLITEASIALDLDADTSTLADYEYYVVDVSTNLPVSPNISPVGVPSCTGCTSTWKGSTSGNGQSRSCMRAGRRRASLLTCLHDMQHM